MTPVPKNQPVNLQNVPNFVAMFRTYSVVLSQEKRAGTASQSDIYYPRVDETCLPGARVQTQQRGRGPVDLFVAGRAHHCCLCESRRVRQMKNPFRLHSSL